MLHTSYVHILSCSEGQHVWSVHPYYIQNHQPQQIRYRIWFTAETPVMPHVCSAFFWACACLQWGGSAHLWRHQSPWKICCCSPNVVRNSTQPEFSRTALHSAKVADVVNKFSLPQTVIALYKSHHIAWNGRISNRALLQCVFRILLNESPPPSVPSCWLPRKHLLSTPAPLSYVSYSTSKRK